MLYRRFCNGNNMNDLEYRVATMMEWNVLCGYDEDASVDPGHHEATRVLTRQGAPLVNASVHIRCLLQCKMFAAMHKHTD